MISNNSWVRTTQDIEFGLSGSRIVKEGTIVRVIDVEYDGSIEISSPFTGEEGRVLITWLNKVEEL